jgi:hypothetical protein
VTVAELPVYSNCFELHKWVDENGARRYRALSFHGLVNDVGVNQPVIANTFWTDALHGIIGPANVGKSAVGLAAVLSIGQVLPFLGRDNHLPRGGRVAVLIGEAPANVRSQAMAWDIHHDGKLGDSDLLTVQASIDFSDPNVGGALGDWLAEEEVGTVLIDPLINFIGRGDENDSSHMAAVMRGIRTMSEQLWAPNTVIFIHHANQSGDLRGSRVIRDLSDVLYMASEDGPKGVKLKRNKNRFGVKEDVLQARLQRVVDKDSYVDSIVAILSQTALGQNLSLAPADRQAWDRIRDNPGTKFFTKAELARTFTDSGLARSAAYRAIDALVEAGKLTESQINEKTAYNVKTAE